MSKKKSTKTVKRNSPKKPAWNKRLSPEQEAHVREIVTQILSPLEKRLSSVYSKAENTKANLIVMNTLLEKKGIVEREEFLRDFEKYQSEEVGVIDGMGKMEGNPIFSLYNTERV